MIWDKTYEQERYDINQRYIAFYGEREPSTIPGVFIDS